MSGLLERQRSYLWNSPRLTNGERCTTSGANIQTRFALSSPVREKYAVPVWRSRQAPHIFLVRATIAQNGFVYLLRTWCTSRRLSIEESSKGNFVVFPKARS